MIAQRNTTEATTLLQQFIKKISHCSKPCCSTPHLPPPTSPQTLFGQRSVSYEPMPHRVGVFCAECGCAGAGMGRQDRACRVAEEVVARGEPCGACGCVLCRCVHTYAPQVHLCVLLRLRSSRLYDKQHHHDGPRLRRRGLPPPHRARSSPLPIQHPQLVGRLRRHCGRD